MASVDVLSSRRDFRRLLRDNLCFLKPTQSIVRHGKAQGSVYMETHVTSKSNKYIYIYIVKLCILYYMMLYGC